jgi:glycosyltransferase 2 family protein
MSAELMQADEGAVRANRDPFPWRALFKRAIPALVAVAAMAALILAVDPRLLVRAMSRFELKAVPAVLALAVACYLVQGVRWHYLLREVDVRLGIRDSVLLNTAGQAITAIFPLGDLTRAIFASEATGAEFGVVAATVTVQELSYTLILVLSAAPVLLQLREGLLMMVVVVGGIAAVLAILTVRPVFCFVHRLIARTPLLRRFLRQIDGLHRETAVLLRRPDTLSWTVLDALRAALAITVVWLIVRELHPGELGWWQAAFVLALSYVGGAISLIPGGAGANEASMVGLLMLFHVDPATAAAAALLQRLFTTGVATTLGWSAYLVARRRFDLGSVLALRPPADYRGSSDQAAA